LLTLLDSPLNKAGLLQVFIHTRRGVLIEINPQTRIPRTFKRFCGLMVQLLHELKISSVQAEGAQTLLKIIKNPVTQYFPVGCQKIGTTSDASKLVNLQEYVLSLDSAKPVVFVVGAMAKGSDEVDYAENYICFSNYPLSASVACSKITNSFEQLWGIL
jgi:rRNA small subunit pseudouridine methyltransferase Nep1